MKTLLLAAIGLSATAFTAPAFAQDLPNLGPVQTYGSLGYSNLDAHGVDLGAVQGRLGARFGRYFGVEGELSGGIDQDHTFGATGVPLKVGLNNQEAIYGVGYLPLTPSFDLFARGGFGGADGKVGDYASAPAYRYGGESWNYGAGVQYFYKGGANGLRVDYTRYDYEQTQPDANVWSVALVHKF